MSIYLAAWFGLGIYHPTNAQPVFSLAAHIVTVQDVLSAPMQHIYCNDSGVEHHRLNIVLISVTHCIDIQHGPAMQ